MGRLPRPARPRVEDLLALALLMLQPLGFAIARALGRCLLPLGAEEYCWAQLLGLYPGMPLWAWHHALALGILLAPREPEARGVIRSALAAFVISAIAGLLDAAAASSIIGPQRALDLLPLAAVLLAGSALALMTLAMAIGRRILALIAICVEACLWLLAGEPMRYSWLPPVAPAGLAAGAFVKILGAEEIYSVVSGELGAALLTGQLAEQACVTALMVFLALAVIYHKRRARVEAAEAERIAHEESPPHEAVL